MTRRRGALGALAALGLSLVAGLAAVPAAQAVTGSPPVTTPDVGTMYPGNAVYLSPVNNDHDPDNDALTICRLGTESYRGLETDFVGNDWAVFSRPSAKPGTYTFTYYACDFSYLTAGTITITVAESPDIKVKKIASQPGRLRVTNPADFKIRFLYGSFREDTPDGSIVIDKGATIVITVHRPRIDWIAFNRRGDIYVGTGKVLNIKLPAGDHPPAAGRSTLPSRLAEAWRTA
jgi:hypothetical protein